MIQLLRTYHRDQIGIIDGELTRLDEVTQEVQVLQDRLVHCPPPAAADRPADTADSGAAPGSQSPAEFNAWLYQRLATLQGEQQSLWQKVTRFLSGKLGTRSS